MTVPPEYKGSDLPSHILYFLGKIKKYKIEAKTTTPAGKTLILFFNGIRCGYINYRVLREKGVMGFDFGPWSSSPNHACPPNIENNLIQLFCDRYKCTENDIFTHKGSGDKNKTRKFLIIRNPDVAINVLLQDYIK